MFTVCFFFKRVLFAAASAAKRGSITALVATKLATIISAVIWAARVVTAPATWAIMLPKQDMSIACAYTHLQFR